MNIRDIFPDLRGTSAPKLPPTERQPPSTKAGPGCKHSQGDGSRTTEQLSAGAFGRWLRNSINRANARRTAKRLAREQAIAYERTST